MSFRTRLTSFFVLIVVVPMIAVGVLVFRLIGDSEQGKADARASGLAKAAASLYEHSGCSGAGGRADDRAGLELRARRRPAVSSVRPGRSGRVESDHGHAWPRGDRRCWRSHCCGSREGKARAQAAGGSITVTASTLTAARTRPGSDRRFRRSRGRASRAAHARVRSLGRAGALAAPRTGAVTLGGRQLPGGHAVLSWVRRSRRIKVTVLSDRAVTASSVNSSRLVAAVFIAAFLLLAFAFSVLASRALQGQISRFLEAARRLGGGDFSVNDPDRGARRFRRPGRRVQQHVHAVGPPPGRALAGTRATTRVDSADRSDLRLQPRSPRSARAGVEDRDGRRSGRPRPSQRARRRRSAAGRDRRGWARWLGPSSRCTRPSVPR